MDPLQGKYKIAFVFFVALGCVMYLAACAVIINHFD